MIQFLVDRGIQATVTPDGKLNLKGLSGLCDETRQEVLTFARDHKAAILSELQPPPPDLSKIRPEHRSEYTDLWHRACELENYTPGDAPYEDRIKRVPELNELVERMRVLEDQTKAKPPTRPVKKIPGLPDDLCQAPAGWRPVESDHEYHRNSCPACGERQWWRKNQPGSKWICGRCHPPVTGIECLTSHTKIKTPALTVEFSAVLLHQKEINHEKRTYSDGTGMCRVEN